MALRLRRRNTPLAQEAAEHIQDAARATLERASEVSIAATAALESVKAATPGSSRRLRRGGTLLLGLFVALAAAAAFYAWWTRRHRDEEFARLPHTPARPDVQPSAPPPPAAPAASIEDAPAEPVASPGSFEPVDEPIEEPVTSEPAAQPWMTPVTASSVTAPAASVPARAIEVPAERESHVDRQRVAWNSAQREVPLFVLPLRPTVPFRGAATPAAERTRLPGSSPSFRQ